MVMKIKNVELFGLQQDLLHLVTEKIKLKVKGEVYLTIEHLKPLIDSYEKVRSDFVKEYGSGNEKDGYSISTEQWNNIDEKNKKEWDQFNNQEKEIKTNLKTDMFKDIESEYPYQFLFKILI